MLDGSGTGAYNRTVRSSRTAALTAAVLPDSPPARRRRLPSPTEHARRVEWGKRWGSVGAEWKRKHPAKGA